MQIVAGPFQFVDDAQGARWEGPPGWFAALDFQHADEVAALPFNADRAIAGKPAAGLFAVPDGSVDGRWDVLTSEHPRDVVATSQLRTRWSDLFGFSPPGNTLAEMIAGELMLSNDRPLMPDRKRSLEVHFGPVGMIERRKFDIRQATSHRGLVLSRLHEEYEDAEAIGGVTHARKWLGWQMSKLWGLRSHAQRLDRFAKGDGTELIPPAKRAGHQGPLDYATTFTDDFSGDLSAWIQVAGTWSTSTGGLRKTANTGTYESIAYASPFSSADHDAEATLTDADHFHGPGVRVNTALVDGYFQSRWASVNRVWRADNKNRTDILTISPQEPPLTYWRLDGSGSTLEAFEGTTSPASTSLGTISDTNYSFLRAGCVSWAISAGTTQLDDFKATGEGALQPFRPVSLGYF